MKSLNSLTDRQLNQVRAALKFWADVAEVSKVHPSHHPGVAGLFKRYAPLTASEIDDLLTHVPMVQLVSVPTASEVFDISPARLKLLLEQFGVHPEHVSGRMKLYSADAVRRTVEQWKRG